MMKSLQRILYVGLLVVTSAVMADTIALLQVMTSNQLE